MITYEKYAEIRDEKKLTDGKVAEMCGFGRSTFSDWKAGRSIPKIEKMQKIADALEMDYFAFVGPVGKFSSLNPNRPNTDADIIFNVPGEDMKIHFDLLFLPYLRHSLCNLSESMYEIKKSLPALPETGSL